MDLKALLLTNRLPVEPVEVPGVGTVRVRGLSREELSAMGAAIRSESLDQDGTEVRYLALGMVEPPLTEDEVAQWRQGAGSDEVSLVLDKILELSGLAEGAAKSDLQGA